MNFKYIDLDELGSSNNVIDFSKSETHFSKTNLSGGDSNKENENIYIYLKQNKLDNQLVLKNKFILKPHQTIPKYYLLNHVDKIILHYSMGSGKTAAAIFIATYFMDADRRNKFINVYNGLNSNETRKPVYVIGAWQTQNAFVQDLIKPEFHFIEMHHLKSIREKMKSSFKEIREEGELEYSRLIKSISKKINFSGYQGFFNECFPDLNEKKYTQDATLLIEEFNKGQIHVNKKFLESLRNSVVIIDEMQRLYSSQGLNSYGFALGAIIKQSKEYNIKYVFLTGTILNNSLYEVVDVMNIMNETEFEPHEKYLDQITILNDVNTYKISETKRDYINKYFERIFIYYNQTSSEDNRVAEIKPYNNEISKPLMFIQLPSKTELKDTIESVNATKHLKQLYYKSPSDFLPDEIHIGNLMIKDSEQYMNLYCVEVEGYQAEKYQKYLMETSTLSELSENDETVSIHDGIFDKNDNLIYYASGYYSGTGLKYPYIKKYSAIGTEMVRMCLYNTIKGEKTVLYHDKIMGFGLKQYIEILNQNGFILYGTSPKQDTRCKICGVEYKDHKNNPNSKNFHDFLPMRYAALYGDLSDKERKQLTQLYNAPNNLYGDFISVMFISSVAYSGVSFFNTNHIIILNKINNLSKWKQIYARIIRTHSHDLLPKEKKWSNVYTMIIKHPNEKSNGVNQFIREEKYYKLRNILNQHIDIFIKDLAKNSITDALLNNQEEITKWITIKNEPSLFKQDLIEEMKFVFKRTKINIDQPWVYQNLIRRICDPDNQLSFINLSLMPLKEISSIVIKQNYLKLFKVDTDYLENRRIYCIPINSVPKNTSEKLTSKFKYSDIMALNIESKRLKNYLIELSTTITEKGESNIIYVRNALIKLLQNINYNFKDIIHYKTFWDAIYLIRDEYYSDDNTNFIKNHTSDNRNYDRMAGFYYYDHVILKPKVLDEPVKTIDKIKIPKILPKDVKLNDSPFFYRITSQTASETSIWYLRVIIYEPNEYEDRRKQTKGLSCGSFDIARLYPFFPNLPTDDKRKNVCIKLLTEICNIANEKKIKIPTPFG